PPCGARASVMAWAPVSDVAVPTTVAPAAASSRAMARPMPREAPVTRAILPASTGSDMSASQSFQRFFQGRRISDVEGVDFAVDALDQSRQDLAGPAFDDVGDAVLLHGLYGLHPADRVPCLAHQRIAGGIRVRRPGAGARVGPGGGRAG